MNQIERFVINCNRRTQDSLEQCGLVQRTVPITSRQIDPAMLGPAETWGEAVRYRLGASETVLKQAIDLRVDVRMGIACTTVLGEALRLASHGLSGVH